MKVIITYSNGRKHSRVFTLGYAAIHFAALMNEYKDVQCVDIF